MITGQAAEVVQLQLGNFYDKDSEKANILY